MLDSDVVVLFGYQTKYLNRQVQRNVKRFPENYVFTDYSITMLAGILKSEVAIAVSLKIDKNNILNKLLKIIST